MYLVVGKTQAQDLCLYIPWSAETAEQRIGEKQTKTLQSKSRERIGSLLKTIAKQLMLVGCWGGSEEMVASSVRTVVRSILRSKRRSPEGVVTVEDVCKNIATCVAVVTEAERMLSKAFVLV